MSVTLIKGSLKAKMHFFAADTHRFLKYSRFSYCIAFETEFEPWITSRNWQDHLAPQKCMPPYSRPTIAQRGPLTLSFLSEIACIVQKVEFACASQLAH